MTDDRTGTTTHESWIGKLDAYLDGELDAQQMKELDRTPARVFRMRGGGVAQDAVETCDSFGGSVLHG